MHLKSINQDFLFVHILILLQMLDSHVCFLVLLRALLVSFKLLFYFELFNDLYANKKIDIEQQVEQENSA